MERLHFKGLRRNQTSYGKPMPVLLEYRQTGPKSRYGPELSRLVKDNGDFVPELEPEATTEN